MRERPENFALKRDHPLAKGLVFAGLGQAPGSVRYIDSSPYSNNGVLTTINPGSDWTWISRLNRWGMYYRDSRYLYTNSFPITGLSRSFALWLFIPNGGSIASTAPLLQQNSSFSNTGGAHIVGLMGVFQTTNRLRFCIGDGVGRDFVVYSETLPTQQWLHIAGVVMSGLGGQCTIYIDGKSVVSGGTNRSIFQTARPVYCAGMSTFFATVLMLDAVIYDHALGLNEIQELADPSNVMLSGMLQPPKRKYYVIKPTTTLPTKKYLVIRGRAMSYSS